MFSPAYPFPQVRRSVTNAGGSPPGFYCSGNMGAGLRDRKMGAGCGPGIDHLQGRYPSVIFCMEYGRYPAKGGHRIEGDRTLSGTLENHVWDDQPMARGISQVP